MDTQKNTYFPLSVGPVTLGIRFDAPGYTETLAEYFQGYAGTANTDLSMDFELISHGDSPPIPESLIQAKQMTGDGFSIGQDLFCGRFDPRDDTWRVRVKTCMTKGQTTRVFEQFLYQAFYSACRRKASEAFLLHSSGVIAESQGFLFVGASGMGKSTIAELSRAYGVVNDEINILSSVDDGFLLHGSPFNAYCKEKIRTTASVRALFLLSHAEKCRIEEVSPARAIAECTGQIVPPLGLEDEYSPSVASLMMRTAGIIIGKVPVYRLSFPLGGGFWPIILKRFT